MTHEIRAMSARVVRLDADGQPDGDPVEVNSLAVHHADGNPRNNAPENLILFDPSGSSVALFYPGSYHAICVGNVTIRPERFGALLAQMLADFDHAVADEPEWEDAMRWRPDQADAEIEAWNQILHPERENRAP